MFVTSTAFGTGAGMAKQGKRIHTGVPIFPKDGHFTRLAVGSNPLRFIVLGQCHTSFIYEFYFRQGF